MNTKNLQPTLLSSTHYPLKPASLDLATFIGRRIAFMGKDHPKRSLYERIYSHMTPEAKARADLAASWLVVEGGARNEW